MYGILPSGGSQHGDTEQVLQCHWGKLAEVGNGNCETPVNYTPRTCAQHPSAEPPNGIALGNLLHTLNNARCSSGLAQGDSSIGTKSDATAAKLSMASSCPAARRMLRVKVVPGRCMVRLAIIRDEYKATSAFAMV
jgi:hypothetical protein